MMIKKHYQSLAPAMMTKKHYQSLATAIRRIRDGLAASPMNAELRDAVLETVTAQIAWACAQDNNKFDSIRFYAAARPDKAE
jgi:hypothetical protein